MEKKKYSIYARKYTQVEIGLEIFHILDFLDSIIIPVEKKRAAQEWVQFRAKDSTEDFSI